MQFLSCPLHPTVQNANHIFNAVHASMRLWESSLLHNGLSFFPAHVPVDTTLYQGSSGPSLPLTYGYLAFELEHAAAFARPPQTDPQSGGWLRTFTTTRHLDLLYIDGLSAAKTDLGTQDSQAYILNTTGTGSIINGYGVRLTGGDHARVVQLCELATSWGLDGFVRAEFGFELVLCDFHLVRLTESIRTTQFAGPGSSKSHVGLFHLWRGLQAAADGITDAVTIDYDSMVTALASDLALTDRRLDPSDKHVHAQLREAVKTVESNPGVNWQKIVDKIIARYRVLPTLSQDQAKLLIQPFIDHDSRPEPSLDRCIHQYIPRTQRWSVPRMAITQVMRAICETLFAGSDTTDLVEWLDWSVWKACIGCEPQEICFTAIWPWGDIESHKNPRCITETDVKTIKGQYWRE